MDEARDGGRPVATAPITLVQETESQAGILVFLPVYRTQVIPESIEQRQTQLTGFAVGVFRIGDLIRSAQQGLEIKTRLVISMMSQTKARFILSRLSVSMTGVRAPLLQHFASQRPPRRLSHPNGWISVAESGVWKSGPRRGFSPGSGP